MRVKLWSTGLLTVTMIFCMAGGVCASGYDSYVYNKKGQTVPAPDAVELSVVLRGESFGTDGFSTPQDLFCTPEGDLYIADTGNNRIVVLEGIGGNAVDTPARVIDSFNNGEKKDGFSGPRGVFVDTEDNLFVADTGNARIVKLGKDGALLQIINQPDSTALPDKFSFAPVKLALDIYRQIYVISEGYNAGLMVFNTSGEYLQSMGAPRVAVSVIDQFWRKYSTKAQRERTQSFVPTEYSNLSVDKDGFIFVTTSAYDAAQYASGQLKPLRKLNAKGSDVFNRVSDPVGDSLKGGNTYKGPSAFVGVCQLGWDNFALLDQKRGRVFAYNGEGELLYEFGGPGAYYEGIESAAALAFYENRYYVLDYGKEQISVFGLTEYGQLFSGIAKARQEIDFRTEEQLWNEVMMRNANCVLAMRGLGNAAYKRKDMSVAMRYFKLAGDQKNYSKAYAFVRRDWIGNNAWIMLLVVMAAIAALIVTKRLRSRVRAFTEGRRYWKSLTYSKHILLHPMDGFWDLKREKRGSTKGAVTLLAACLAVVVLSNLCTGFIFNSTDLESYSILSVGYVLVAVALWVISQWCVTSLMYGEGKLRDIFISTCYSLTPYIIVNTIAIIISRALLAGEGDLYHVLTALAIFWMVVLLVAGVKQTHDFSMAKTLLAILITLVVIMLILFIGMLVMALSQQLGAFVRDLADEVSLRI